MLKVFISHATEDGEIADALAKTLRASFFRSIEITKMSEIDLGVNWRQRIDDSINETDLLIAIATGRLKPSHSFTGYEVGNFASSVRSKPNMGSFPQLKRLMIPFAVLERVPDTMNEFEGITIDPLALRAVRFDPKNLASELKNDRKPQADGAVKQIIKLLADLESIMSSDAARPQNLIIQEERLEELKANAQILYKDLIELMYSRKMSVVHPEPKIIIRSNPHLSNGVDYDVIETASIQIEGKVCDIFGVSQTHGSPVKWSDFISKADGDIAYHWRKALAKLISPSIYSDLDDNSILSYDKKRLYRIFTSTTTEYYSGEMEYKVYIVEILRRRDYGDADTTLLLKALEISLAYRFMFLEETSEFSPAFFRAERPETIQVRASNMIDQLNLLLLSSNEYGLGDPKNIIRILGADELLDVDDKFQQWDRERTTLYNAAQSLLKLKQVEYPDKNAFIEKVSQFCEHTHQMSDNYVSAVTEALQKKLREQVALPRSVEVRKSPPRLPARANGKARTRASAAMIAKLEVTPKRASPRR